MNIPGKKRWLAVLMGIALFCGVISCRSISTPVYNLKTQRLEGESGIKIVLISDLHSTIYGKDQSPLIEKIKKQNPDLILLTGDIFDDIVPDDGTHLMLSGIGNLAPVYYVTGNHEYMSRNITAIREALESYRVTILSDRYVKINVNSNEIILAGIEDPEKRFYESPDYNQNRIMEETFRELDALSHYKILLAHRPERISYYRRFSFDLILSGHAHGGQVRIPLILNGLYAPNQGIFPKYAGGRYQHGSLTHIVSRGLSVYPKLPRIFNPPELVVVILEPEPPQP